MSFDTIAVIGCGQMGIGIAEAIASAGFRVKAIKATGGDLERVSKELSSSLEERVEQGELDATEAELILGRIEVTAEFSSVADCDLVIEAAIEDLALKIDLLRDLEDHMSAGAILASSTSSLPLEQLAEALRRPEQFLALHFLTPARAMKLVEVGYTERTAPGVFYAAESFCRAIGKEPVEVKASPGFIVNRLMVPVLLHAIETLESGIAGPEAIDAAMMLGCGHPMGPLALADLVGLDVLAAMAANLQTELRDSRYRLPSLLRRLVVARHFGRKTGAGVYDYSGETPTVNPAIHLRPIMLADAAE